MPAAIAVMPLAARGPLTLADSMDPGWRGRELAALLNYRGTDGWGPRRPRWKPGDGYVVAGVAVGMAVGGGWGFTVGIVTGVVGIAVGGVCGALAGSLLGALLRKRKIE